jgi:hypothetical protein
MIDRRSFLLAAVAACSKRSQPVSPPPPKSIESAPPIDSSEQPVVRVLEWTMDPWPGGPAMAKIVVPTWGAPGELFPLVVALHGRGEALKGPERGAGGWPDDYAMLRAFDRIRHPPLVDADFENLADPVRLAAISARPFRGLVVACPYVPDLELAKGAELEKYGRAIVEQLIPRARKEAPVIADAASTGIDGVSLGGATALRAGLVFAKEFGAVGAIQPAIGEWQASELTELARAARAKNPKLALRLLTSKDDGFRQATEALSTSWKRAGIEHTFLLSPGPHDYVFNRGPGVYELLDFHDRALHLQG